MPACRSRVSADTLVALQAYDWPGNVRQFRNLIDWLLIMAPGKYGDPIGARCCRRRSAPNAPRCDIDPTADIMGLPLREARDLFGVAIPAGAIAAIWRQHQPDEQLVGMERSACIGKLKQLGVISDEGWGDERLVATRTIAGSRASASGSARARLPGRPPASHRATCRPTSSSCRRHWRTTSCASPRPTPSPVRCSRSPSPAIRRFPTLGRRHRSADRPAALPRLAPRRTGRGADRHPPRSGATTSSASPSAARSPSRRR